MAEWICTKCQVAVEEADDIAIHFGEMDGPPGVGFRCPSCGMEWLEGGYVTDELNSAEQMLDGK